MWSWAIGLCNASLLIQFKDCFSVDRAGVGKVRAAHEVQVLAAYGKVSILVVIHSVLDWDSERLLPGPNVFISALAFSPEWVPDVFLFFFFRPEAQWLGETSRCCANHQIIHTNWHHLMSRTTSSKRNYIHLNLSNTSAKETAGKKKKKKLSTFNLRRMQTAKTKVGHVQVIMNALQSVWWVQHV